MDLLSQIGILVVSLASFAVGGTAITKNLYNYKKVTSINDKKYEEKTPTIEVMIVFNKDYALCINNKNWKNSQDEVREKCNVPEDIKEIQNDGKFRYVVNGEKDKNEKLEAICIQNKILIPNNGRSSI